MKVFYNTEKAAGKIKNAVVTTGSFDGVHIGHKAIINRLNQIARAIQGESVLITFHPHPRKVLYPEQRDLKLINTQEEKIELLRKAGLDNLIIIPFSIEFSKTTSHDFVTSVLIGQLAARVVVVGHNHHFGHNREGDYSYLHTLSKEYHFDVEEIPLKDIENETVSSTKIRRSLFEGNIQRANAYLDHQYIMHGQLENSRLLLPEIDLHGLRLIVPEEEKLVPPPGIYATNLFLNTQCLKSMTLIPAVNGNRAVDISLVYDDPYLVTGHGTLYFYKKVSDLNMTDEKEALIRSWGGIKELVEELIY